MNAYVAVLISVIAGGLLAPIGFTVLGDTSARNRVRRIFLQYVFALLIVIAITGDLRFSLDVWPIFVTGIFVTGGVFFQWRAKAWSLSRSIIFLSLANVIPLILSAIFLHEWRALMNPWLALGVSCALGGLGLHAWHSFRLAKEDEKKKGSKQKVPGEFYIYGVVFMVIFGVATFFENNWAKTGVPISDFLRAWYSGTFIGSFAMLCGSGLLSDKPSDGERKLNMTQEVAMTFFLAACIVVSLWTMFVSLQYFELTVILPFYSVCIVLGYTLVSVFFKEWKLSDRRGLVLLGLGIVGAIIIATVR